MKFSDENEPLTRGEFREVIEDLVKTIMSYMDAHFKDHGEKIQNIQEDINLLKDGVSHLTKDVDNLKVNVRQLTYDVSHLKNDVIHIKNNIVLIKDEMSDMRDDGAVARSWDDRIEDHEDRLTLLEKNKVN